MAKKTQHIAGSHIVETQKPYELMLVFKPDILESALEKKLKEFEAFLDENGGTIEVKDVWGKRELAYNIKQYEQGNYVLYNLTLPSTFLKELDEYLRIHNDVMRFLVVSLKKDYTYEKPKEQFAEEPKKEEGDEKKPEGEEKKESKKDEKKTSKSLDDKLSKILNDDELKL